MSVDILLLIFVAFSALAFTVQCISLWRMARTAQQIAERVEKRTDALDREVQSLIVRGRELTDSLEPVIQLGHKFNTQVAEVSQLLKRRAEDLDQFAAEMMAVGRDQATKIDYVVSDTVQKFEHTTEVIQKDVLEPAIEISAFFKGIRSGLDYLFSRKGQAGRSGKPEEELLI